MKLNTLLESIKTSNVLGPVDVEINGMAYDSRQISKGNLFVAISGLKSDGADFITEAVSRGAIAVVSELDLHLGSTVTSIQVPCAREALAELSAIFYKAAAQQITLIGVTGTNGKTTTTQMIRDLLRVNGQKTGLLGTVRYDLGNRSIPASRTTPESLELHQLLKQMKQSGCINAVLEVSSHAIALKRIHGLDFKICAFTNLTQDHLDFHKDMQHYFEVKASLFEQLNTEQAAAINLDDPWGKKLLKERSIKAKVITYGFHDRAMVQASKVKIQRTGTRFYVQTPWGATRVRLKLLGRFNIHNALAALAVCGLYGLDFKSMIKALEQIESIPGRLECIASAKNNNIFVDYAHTDDALKNVLQTLREICRGKLIVVFGCGGNRDTEKRQLMGKVAAELADYSIITSDNPRNEDPNAIAAGIVKGFDNSERYEVILDRQTAIQQGIKRLSNKKDILLVAGKGHEQYQEIQGAVIPFDDAEIIREELN